MMFIHDIINAVHNGAEEADVQAGNDDPDNMALAGPQ